MSIYDIKGQEPEGVLPSDEARRIAAVNGKRDQLSYKTGIQLINDRIRMAAERGETQCELYLHESSAHLIAADVSTLGYRCRIDAPYSTYYDGYLVTVFWDKEYPCAPA